MAEKQHIIQETIDSSSTVAGELAKQLGTDGIILARGETDMRRFGNISTEAIIPLIYCDLRAKRNKAFGRIFTSYLNLGVSVEARGRRDIIRMQQATLGGNANVGEEIQKPGWVQRNITNRDWKDEQRRLNE